MVVSITNISPTHGSRYYAQEGHYSENKTFNATVTQTIEQPSNWYGKLAQTVGVHGAIDSQVFNDLLHGRSPNGQTLIDKNHVAKGAKARAGIDLTTSAPKSVSIQALVFGDQRLELAHREATARMLDFLEERYTFTRQMLRGCRTKVQTGAALIAQFHHDTSRELDPQLHTHNILLNLQQLHDGKWRSLDNEAIYRAKMLLGLVYRNELAREVQRLGYEIEVTNYRQGLWELKGFSSKGIDQFSKRRQQIGQQAGSDASSQHKAWVAIASGRKKKQFISREALTARWQEEAIALNLAPIEPKRETQDSTNSFMAEALVQAAVDQLVCQSGLFRQEAIEKFVLTQVGQTSLSELQAAIAHHPNLILSTDSKGQRFCIFQEKLNYDRTANIPEFSRPAFTQPDANAVAGLRSDHIESSSTHFGADGRWWQNLPSCPGISTRREGLGELEPSSSDTRIRRAVGETATMAQTSAHSPDSTPATPSNSTDGNQPSEWGLQQADGDLSAGVNRASDSAHYITQTQDDSQLERDRR